jgi:hypothetical protein
LTFGEDTDYIERLAKKERFKVLRNAKIGVSTRRLEEEGLATLIQQYGKSTVNDFLGKRTDASELNYNFGHGKDKDSAPKFDTITKQAERINDIKETYDHSREMVHSTRAEIKSLRRRRDKKVVFLLCLRRRNGSCNKDRSDCR